MPAEAHCTFCNLIAGAAEVSVCYEDADALAFMDIQPVNSGHVLVVPRAHHESVLDVPQELGVHLFRVTMRLVAAVQRVTKCEGVNIVVNSGAVAGQDEMHYHVHIIPRRAGDGFDVPLPFDGSEMPDRTVLDMQAARIIAALRDPMPRAARSGAEGEGEGEATVAGKGAERGENAPAAAAGRGRSESREASGMAPDGSSGSDLPDQEVGMAVVTAGDTRAADTPGGGARRRELTHRTPYAPAADDRGPAAPPRAALSADGRRLRLIEGAHGELLGGD